MRIIREGRIPGKRVYKSTCRNCRTEFEFNAEEATLIADQREGDYLRINCPLSNCAKPVCVDPKLYER